MPRALDAGLRHGERRSVDTLPGRSLRLLLVAGAAYGLAWSAGAESRPGGIPNAAGRAEADVDATLLELRALGCGGNMAAR